ncbi:unnamed protein product [Lactuca virosa]|uniref:TOD1/MUCI70 glycosyltransferase-like domain-containing protein n=1 Tax=Lactuca virosa TaxID=75947 RepID=A0AAU9MYR0_9ASTR|nr:unnamed protein product [Lactuca virosa]
MLPERRGVPVGSDLIKAADHNSDHGLRAVRRSRRAGRMRLLFWLFSLAALFSICFAIFGFKMFFHGVEDHQSLPSLRDIKDVSIEPYTIEKPKKKPHRARFNPCEVELIDSVDLLNEPKSFWNFVNFSLQYIQTDHTPSHENPITPRFGGHQTLEEREQSFHVTNQTIHCGFIKGPQGFPNTGFDLVNEDKMYMNSCTVVVSSCIFGSSDFLRRPTSKMISEYSKKNVCFVMFVDKETLVKLSKEGSIPDEKGFIGLWRIIVVNNLPYNDMRKTGKVPKFLSHRLFPSARYSIWLDSKMRLHTDPIQIIEYFLWRKKSEFAISNHYTRHCMDSINLTIQTLINPYQVVRITDVPEGSFIVRAHTPMSNLFSCLWFNEVDRFTSRDQLSFGYTFLKLKRMNPDKPLVLHMFKDCERRAITKLFHHRNP